MKRIVALLVSILLLNQCYPFAHADVSRIALSDNISNDSAVTTAIHVFSETCSLAVEQIIETYGYSASLSDDRCVWNVAFVPYRRPNLRFHVYVDAYTGECRYHTSDRFIGQLSIIDTGVDYANWFQARLDEQEQIQGNESTWDYLAHAAFTKACYGWGWEGNYDWFTLPSEDEISYDEAVSIAVDYLHVQYNENPASLIVSWSGMIDEFGKRYESSQFVCHRYWSFTIDGETQEYMIELSAATGEIEYDWVTEKGQEESPDF